MTENEYRIAWDYYSESHKDAVQRKWDGIVVLAIDGSVDRNTENMGAGFAVSQYLPTAR